MHDESPRRRPPRKWQAVLAPVILGVCLLIAILRLAGAFTLPVIRLPGTMYGG